MNRGTSVLTDKTIIAYVVKDYVSNIYDIRYKCITISSSLARITNVKIISKLLNDFWFSVCFVNLLVGSSFCLGDCNRKN